MALFSDLADELLLEIWQYTLAPEDIENFVLVSKTVYRLASPFIRRHQALRQQYSTCANIGITTIDNLGLVNTPDVAINYLSETLKHILAEPNIGLYIQHFCLKRWITNWQPQDYFDSVSPEQQRLLHFPYGTKDIALFKDALSKTILPEKLERWTLALESGNEDPILALLFTLCPNIVKGELAGYHNDKMAFRRLMEDVFEDTNSKTRVLQNLNSFSLHWEGFDGETINLIKSLATFSSLKSIKAHSVRAFASIPGTGVLKLQFSKVEDLSLRDSVVSAVELDYLLGGLGSLRSFNYLWPYYKIPGWSSPVTPHFDPAALSTVLLNHAKSTLLSVHFRSFEDKNSDPVFIQSLHSFEILRFVETSISSETQDPLSLELLRVSYHRRSRLWYCVISI